MTRGWRRIVRFLAMSSADKSATELLAYIFLKIEPDRLLVDRKTSPCFLSLSCPLFAIRKVHAYRATQVSVIAVVRHFDIPRGPLLRLRCPAPFFEVSQDDGSYPLSTTTIAHRLHGAEPRGLPSRTVITTTSSSRAD